MTTQVTTLVNIEKKSRERPEAPLHPSVSQQVIAVVWESDKVKNIKKYKFLHNNNINTLNLYVFLIFIEFRIYLKNNK